MVFISASNELGAFESGVAAALLGAVPAVVVGGAVTIALAGDLDAGSSPTSRASTGSTSSGRNRPDARGRCVGFEADGDRPHPPDPAPRGRRQPPGRASTGATVREVLENLVATYPALRERIFDGDELPQFLNVFIDGSDVRLLDGLDTAGRRRGDGDPAAGGRRRFAICSADRRPR